MVAQRLQHGRPMRTLKKTKLSLQRLTVASLAKVAGGDYTDRSCPRSEISACGDPSLTACSTTFCPSPEPYSKGCPVSQ
jgi:hypothetical protein